MKTEVAKPTYRPTKQTRRTKKRSFSFAILRAARDGAQGEMLTFGDLIQELGDKSFGWAMLLASLVNLLPLPPGTTLLTAIPLMILCGQIALGKPYVWVPQLFASHQFPREKLRRTVVRLYPLSRRLERVMKPRMSAVFRRTNERLFGGLFFLVAVALFIPLPLSGWFPAAALLIASLALIERDGLLLIFAAGLGVASILVTLAVGLSLWLGAEALIN